MSYLFDPENWEWLWTDNNARFILEAFLVNLQIAAIAMVFALIFGLLLALGALSRTFETNEAFFWAAVGYLLLTATVTALIRVLESRYAIRR